MKYGHFNGIFKYTLSNCILTIQTKAANTNHIFLLEAQERYDCFVFI